MLFPRLSEIEPDGLPEVTAELLTVMAWAFALFLVGVTVIEETEFATLTVYEVVFDANVEVKVPADVVREESVASVESA